MADGGAKPDRSRAQQTVSSGNFGLSTDTSCSWVGSCSHHKQTVPEFVWNRTETTSSTRFWPSCSGPHPSVIDVLTPCQTNCIKGVNAPGFDSAELNKAGVKTPQALHINSSKTLRNNTSRYYTVGSNRFHQTEANIG